MIRSEPCLCGAEDCLRCYPELVAERRRKHDDETADDRAEQLRERMEDEDADR